METRRYEARHIAPLAGVSVQTAVRALAMDPPAWTPGFRKIVDYINSQKNGNSEFAELAATLRGQKGTAHAAAALLRTVATLLERL